MKNKTTLALTLLLAIINLQLSFAQDGTNDTTFNPDDTGYGNGTDRNIFSVVSQPDCKIIIAGTFAQYALQSRNGIARINADETLDTTFNPGTGVNNNGNVNTIALQADGKIIIAGDFTSFDGLTYNKIVRLNADGKPDKNFKLPAVTGFLDVTKVLMQPDGKVLVGGYSSDAEGKIIRLNADGSIDHSFSVGIAGNGAIQSIALQDDGKIIVVGGFTTFAGLAKQCLVRLNTNGSVDTGFIHSYHGNNLYTAAVQADGKIYVGGQAYTEANSNPVLFRYNNNGSDDATFNVQNMTIKDVVYSIVIQPDGKLIITGDDVVRLNVNGSIDASFLSPHPNNPVNAAALTMQGKIILAGSFLLYNDVSENYITVVNADGTKDMSFDMGGGTGADNTIYTIAKQVNGKIIITGDFNHYNGVLKNNIARLNEDGLLDTSYDGGMGVNGRIALSAMTPDGKLIIAGNFSSYNGTPVNQLARINADGTLDTTFKTGNGFKYIYNLSADTFTTIDVQPDGKILLGGYFNAYRGNESKYLARINTDGTFDTTFNTDFIYKESNGAVTKVLVLADEKRILIASNGPGVRWETELKNTLFKVDFNGLNDAAFTPLTNEWIAKVDNIVVQKSGNIVVSGVYFTEDPAANYRLMRINTDGSIDKVFQEGGFRTPLYYLTNMYAQADDKIIIVGGFTKYGGINRLRIARINADGSLDETFNPGLSAFEIKGLVPQHDKLIVVGSFNTYNKTGRNRIARLTSRGTLGTKTAQTYVDNIIAYKNNNGLTVTSSNKNIASIAVYDLTGRLIVRKNTVNAATAQINNLHLASSIIIVNISLEDGTVVSKKIY